MYLSRRTIENIVKSGSHPVWDPKALNSKNLDLPERVIQVGEGNFLRGFVDWMVHRLNQAGLFQGRIVVVAPRPTGRTKVEQINVQDGLYTVWLRGISEGQQVDQPEIVSAVSRAIDPYEDWQGFLKCAENKDIDIFVSNTTESGIVYQPENYVPTEPISSFPGKLTAYLYHRFVYFDGDSNAGMHIVPCELIENNGDVLRDIVLQHAKDWGFPEAFRQWVNDANDFCNTLVDRIVTGHPPEPERTRLFTALGYEDPLLTMGEPFHLFAIDSKGTAPQQENSTQTASQESLVPKESFVEGFRRGDLSRKWPFHEIGLNVKYVSDISPYRVQKVRILNGAHTAMAYLARSLGLSTVRQAVTDPLLSQFVNTVIDLEIVPIVQCELPDVDRETIHSFAQSVLERFANPFVEHKIMDLTLNGLSKFRIRLLPVLEQFSQLRQTPPQRLSLALAAFLLFYKSADDGQVQWEVRDDPVHVAAIRSLWANEPLDSLKNTIVSILGLTEVWGQDVNAIPGLANRLVEQIEIIRQVGTQQAIMRVLQTDAL